MKSRSPSSSSSILSELFVQVTDSGNVTILDRSCLKSILLEGELDEEAHLSLNRMLKGVRRGYLKLAP